MMYHLTTHIAEKPFVCVYCKRRFKRNVDSKIHERMHTRKKLLCCNDCDQKLLRKTQLLNHRRIYDTENKTSQTFVSNA